MNIKITLKSLFFNGFKPFVGGPLQVSNDEYVNCTYTVFGAVSFGPRFCGVKGAPSKFLIYSFQSPLN